MKTEILKWLTDPEVFAVNRLPAHSDHQFFENKEEAMANDRKWRQSLNGTWEFLFCELNKQADEESERFFEMDFKADFQKIEVPGHIQLQGFEDPQYVNTMYPWDGMEELTPPEIPSLQNRVGRYVRMFDLKESLLGNRIILSFQGVEMAFRVWVNGHFVGYSEDSFTPSEFDISEFVTKTNNKLAVEVYQRSSASWIEDQDFWRFFGIFREVYLYATPVVHVRDLFIKTGLANAYQDGVMNLTVKLSGDVLTCDTVCVEIKDGDGVVANKILKPDDFIVFVENQLAGIPHEKEETGFAFSMSIPQIKAWSAEVPNRYEVTMTLLDVSGKSIEYCTQKIGFRQFELRDKVMYLNGKRIMFHGVNRHEFNELRGRSITEEDMMWDITFLKQNNINAVRTSHYPNQSLWYELCDEYGIYLIDEANLESHGSWQKMGAVEPSINVPGDKKEWLSCVVDRANSMFQRDKNHPSILLWSCGNESYAGEDILAMADFFRKQDDSRIVHYEGCFYTPAFRNCSDVESRMYAKPADIEEYLNNQPDKPFISCEYMHTMGNSGGGLVLYKNLEDQYEMYQGGFIWDYLDQAILLENGTYAYGGDYEDRSTDYNFCGNGIIYADRTYSPKVQEVKFLYQNIELRIQDKQVFVKNKFLFDTLSDYRLVLTLLKDGEVVATSEIQNIETTPGHENMFSMEIDNLMETSSQKASFQETDMLLRASVVLKNATRWADTGFEIAFGEQLICANTNSNSNTNSNTNNNTNNDSNNDEKTIQASTNQKTSLRVAKGDVNIGVFEEAYQIMFSKAEAGLVSLKKEQIEFITRAPKLTFFRAYTDNDKGAGYPFLCAKWMSAGKYARGIAQTFEIINDEPVFEQTFLLPGFDDGKVVVTYVAKRDGKVQITLCFSGVEGESHLPAFGMEFKLKKEFSKVEYYGNGPEENYCDRQSGVKLGRYQMEVKDSLSHYLVPQECGNHTGVRYLSVCNEKNEGLRFESVSSPFEMSVLPYSAMELEEAMHEYELGESNYTWVRILACQTGVGGDDSWGAPVHDEYLVKSNQKIVYTFSVQPV